MAGSVDGLVSGMDTTTIISQLMSLERQPQNRLRSQQNSLQTTLNAYRSLNTVVSAIKDATMRLTAPKGWSPVRATSTVPGSVGVTALAGAAVGSLTFAVKSLASAHAVVSAGTVASRETAVATGPLLLTKGAAAAGFSSIDQGATLTAGPHALRVTQSSTAASLRGGTPLAAVSTVGPGTAPLELEVDGQPLSLVLAAGDHTPAALAAEVTRASAGAVLGSVGSDGALVLTRSHEGSAATLRVVSDHPELGLVATATASAGVDAKLVLDAGAEQVVTRVSSGGVLEVTGTDGNSVTVTTGGGLRTGDVSLTHVDLAAGATLAQVGDAINASKAGVSAAVVEVSAGSFRLQLTSTTTGAASVLAVDPGSLDALGALNSVGEARDAVLTIGSGPGAYDITRPSNTVTGVLAGVTLTLTKADPTASVTVDVARDEDGVLARVNGMVEAVNGALTQIKALTKYDAETKTAGLLMSDGLVRRMASELVTAMTGGVSGAAGSPSSVGLSVNRQGLLVLDKTTMLAAWSADPAAVEAVLGLGSTTAPGTAGRTEALVTRLTKAVDGLIPASIKSRESEVKGYGERISSWDSRLAVREAALKRQFSSMETALGKMQQQSTWLAGQLAGLSNGGQ